jgi:hypothetical protein
LLFSARLLRMEWPERGYVGMDCCMPSDCTCVK